MAMDLSHEGLLVASIKRLYDRRQSSSCDVSFLVGGRIFHAHRLILAAQSEYFEKLLDTKTSFQESNTKNSISLPDKDAEAFESVLEYLYSGYLSISNKNIQTNVQILQMAHEFQMSALFESIGEQLSNNLTASNVLYIYFEAATLYLLPKLQRACLNFVCNHTTEIIEGEEFYQLPSQCMAQVVSWEELGVPEWDILLAVCKWATENEDELTKQEIAQVFQNIRFGLLSDIDASFVDLEPVYGLIAYSGVKLRDINNPKWAEPRVIGRDHFFYCIN